LIRAFPALYLKTNYVKVAVVLCYFLTGRGQEKREEVYAAKQRRKKKGIQHSSTAGLLINLNLHIVSLINKLNKKKLGL